MHVVCGRGSSCFGGVVTLCASGFVDDVIFVHNRRGKGDTSLTKFDVFDGLVLDRVANIRRVPKKRHETGSRNSTDIRNFFTIRFCNKFAAKFLIEDPTARHMLRYTTS